MKFSYFEIFVFVLALTVSIMFGEKIINQFSPPTTTIVEGNYKKYGIDEDNKVVVYSAESCSVCEELKIFF